MKARLSRLVWLTTTLAAGQTPSASPPDLAIRVNVNMIQVDVTVSDKQGQRVPGLTANDFEVLQDGKKQRVTNVLWVGENTAVAGPAVRQLTKQQVRRTVAILVDDLSLDFASLQVTRDAIRKFVETNVEEGDLIALFRSSAGMSFLQQFTSDRRQLLAALGRTQYRNLISSDTLGTLIDSASVGANDPTIGQMAMQVRLGDEAFQRARQDTMTAGMLSSMQYLVQGLREMPGRKSVILFSGSVQLFDVPPAFTTFDLRSQMALPGGSMGTDRSRARTALRNVTDAATRSGVVIYAIDPRGLQPRGLMAQDATMDTQRTLPVLQQRSNEFGASQAGMAALAGDTGGLFFEGTNDISGALREALSDQESYYLVAFQPDDTSFQKAQGAAKYHKLEVRLKTPGLHVRYRKGYLGVPDEEQIPKPVSLLWTAMMSPFRTADVPIRLTPLLRQVNREGPKAGELVPQAMVRTLLHIDASKFAYADRPAESDDPDQTPWRVAKVELALFLFDENTQVSAQTVHTQEIKLRGSALERVQQEGLLHQLELVIARPGGYQLRAAVLDQSSGRAGSAVRFLQVPDLSKRRLLSSDVLVSGEAWSKGEQDRSSPARRTFVPGEKLNYTMQLYNAAISPETRTPKLETQVVLYRNAKIIYRGPRLPLEPKSVPGTANLTLAGSLTLSPTTPVGEYTMEVAIRDTLAPKKYQYTVRTSDFEVQ